MIDPLLLSIVNEINNRIKAVGDRVEKSEQAIETILVRIERRQEHVVEALVALLGTPDQEKLAALTKKLTDSAALLGASIEANKE
jgi:uncharacterized membrane protein affecting hemolysin expression